MVRDVVDPEVLFIGVAQGQSWRRLNAAQNDADAGKAWGQVAHFSVFGLVDRNMQGDGGIILDGGAPDQPSQDRDAGRPDLLGQDLTGRDISVADAGSSGMQVQLTWDVPNADLDLHLYRVGVGPFTDGDCYYANCKANPLDWPPSGAANNPAMDIDDINGFGPENINMVQPDSGDYVAAIHLYNRQGDELPFNYTLRVYQYDQLLIEVTRPVTVCDELASVINIAIASGQVTVSERSDPSSTGGSGVCP